VEDEKEAEIISLCEVRKKREEKKKKEEEANLLRAIMERAKHITLAKNLDEDK
jgi:hypothetical protein